ncbi:hypothetical protein SAMN05192589_107119 [Paracidovorax valerianellae]|uniref:Uncharacterized protein n=1 Tax=Paracidovorax valerianellae TaxID=187868 RepID=A0A1G6VTU5_9BURK|nr:hypothetical protein [Paracidovorax valerianellae]SDD56256.1 hypothetical protein SAMN05192589_107119 [Paracidovorax valerianellae]
MSDKDETQTPADQASQMTAAEAVKRVRRTVVEMVDGRVEGKPAKVPKTRQVALSASEVLAVADHGTHVVVVTNDGQKFSDRDE